MSIGVLGWVLREAPITAKGDVLALIVLADHAHADGSNAWPSLRTIARMGRLSERGARQALRNLEAAGAITVTGRSRTGTTVYRVNLPDSVTAITAPAVADPPAVAAPRQPLPPATVAGEGGNQRSLPPAVAAPEPSRTVPEPSPPVGPPEGDDELPPKPSGNRARELNAYREALAEWTARHFPDAPREVEVPYAVEMAINMGAKTSADVDRILAEFAPKAAAASITATPRLRAVA